MFSYFGHCIYSAIQLSSCKCMLNKLSCPCQLSARFLLAGACVFTCVAFVAFVAFLTLFALVKSYLYKCVSVRRIYIYVHICPLPTG